MFPLLSTVGRIEAKLPGADPAMRAALAPTLAKSPDRPADFTSARVRPPSRPATAVQS